MIMSMKNNEFVVCVDTADFGDFSGDDLLLGKCYEVLTTEGDWLRIVDESGEDYLYPAEWFVPVVLSQEAAARLKQSLVAAA